MDESEKSNDEVLKLELRRRYVSERWRRRLREIKTGMRAVWDARATCLVPLRASVRLARTKPMNEGTMAERLARSRSREQV